MDGDISKLGIVHGFMVLKVTMYYRPQLMYRESHDWLALGKSAFCRSIIFFLSISLQILSFEANFCKNITPDFSS